MDDLVNPASQAPDGASFDVTAEQAEEAAIEEHVEQVVRLINDAPEGSIRLRIVARVAERYGLGKVVTANESSLAAAATFYAGKKFDREYGQSID